MTTKTKPKADPGAELVPIAEQLQAAREERARLGVEFRAWQTEIAKLEATYAALAQDNPAQFANGFPKQKTAAAKLRAEIDRRANGHRWTDILGGADQRIRTLERDLSRRTEANAEDLARAEYEGRGTDNAKRWRKIAALIHEADEEYTGSTGYQLGIVNAVTGLNGQDVLSDPAVAEACKLAARLAEVQPPRAVSLVPLTTDDPARVKSVNGGYIRAGANAADIAEDQPERVERI